MNTSGYFHKNIKHLRNAKGLSQEEFAAGIELSRSVYKRLELGAQPSPFVIIAIADFYKITIDDLLKTDLSEELPIEKQPTMQETLRVLTITIDEKDREYIQFVPEKAKAGYLTGYANPTFMARLPTFRLPNLPAGTYRAFEIKGDSMLPIADGAMLIGRYVERFNQIRSLNTYILVTKEEGVVYKRIIYKDKQRKLICLSDNPAYPPYTIPIENIMEVWSYYCHIQFNGQDTAQKYSLRELMKLSDEVEGLDEILQSYHSQQENNSLEWYKPATQ